MNKVYKILIVIVFSASLFCGGYFSAYKTLKKDKEIIINTVIKNRFETPTAIVNGTGESMDIPGSIINSRYVAYNIEPIPGDIISFDCTKTIHKSVIKRLIAIREDGAWWVLGDNREVSNDSTEYGWVLPSERSHVWVLKQETAKM